MPKKLKEKMYNEELKERFLKESGWKEDSASYVRVMFKRASRLEKSLGKDIYAFTAQETGDLLHFLQLKSKGHVQRATSNLAKYVTWAYEENLTNNPVNYFDTLYNSDNFGEYVSARVRENRQISSEQLKQYESKLTAIGNYVDAALLRGCFLGLRGHFFKDLRELKIDMIKPSAIVIGKRSIPISDYEYNLFVSAHNQPEIVSLRGEGLVSGKYIYLDCEYVFKIANRLEPIKYQTFASKIQAVGEYVEHTSLTPINLYFSGMVEALQKMMEENGTDAETVFGGRSLEFFEQLKEQYAFDGEASYLKYKLRDFFELEQ